MKLQEYETRRDNIINNCTGSCESDRALNRLQKKYDEEKIKEVSK